MTVPRSELVPAMEALALTLCRVAHVYLCERSMADLSPRAEGARTRTVVSGMNGQQVWHTGARMGYVRCQGCRMGERTETRGTFGVPGALGTLGTPVAQNVIGGVELLKVGSGSCWRVCDLQWHACVMTNG